jgi:hypothetical protein
MFAFGGLIFLRFMIINWNIKTYMLELLQLLKISKRIFVYYYCVFELLLGLSFTFTSTPVSLPTWNVYQRDY